MKTNKLLILALPLLLAISACSNSGSQSNQSSQDTSSEEPAPSRSEEPLPEVDPVERETEAKNAFANISNVLATSDYMIMGEGSDTGYHAPFIVVADGYYLTSVFPQLDDGSSYHALTVGYLANAHGVLRIRSWGAGDFGSPVGYAFKTDTYEEVKCNGSFSISKNSVLKAVINVENIYAGQSVNPVVDTDSDGRDGVKYLYKNTGAPDSTYSSSAPINVGSYTVQAVIPETDSFVAASCTAEFEVTYLDAPDNPFSFSGTKGNNDYYITDVYLNAASGYSISGTFGGTYSSRIEYISEAQNVYLRRQSDGALTSAISVSQKLKIDKVAPEFLQGTNGSTVYSDEMSVTVKDEHLMSLTIDGDDVGVKKEEATAELDPENGEKSFKLVAEDEAGNTSSLNMTLKATWLKDKIIPANKLLPLVKSESYKLDNGKWTVSGDSTVYSGGWDVYVNSDGSYTFTKQN